MAQFILPVVGAAIGFTFGGPQGAQLGFALGSTANALFAPKPPGPQIGDLKAPKATYGSVIPYVEGHPRLPGIVIWASEKRAIKNEAEGGKGGLGGAEQSFYTYRIDIICALAENDAGNLRRVWANGELVWSIADDSTQGSVDASAEAPWGAITHYRGADDQLPHPAYETAVGTGNAPAYRGRTTVAIDDLDLGTSGQLPVLTFECGGATAGGVATDLFYAPWANDVEDTIEPISGADFQNDITPVGEGFTFDGEWGTLSWTQIPTDPPGSRATQFALYVPVKFDNSAFEDDFSQPVNYTFEIRQLQPNDGSLGAQTTFPVIVFRQNELGSALSLGISLSYDSLIEGAEIVVVKGLANGTTTTETFGHIPFGSDETYYFRFEVEANPSAPGTALSTKVYVRSDEGGAYPTETFLDSHVTPNFSYILVGGSLEPPGSIYDGVSGFDFRRLKVTRGENDGDRVSLLEPTLKEVVERQCERAGIDLDYVDATDLVTRFVKAMAVTQITSPRAVIENLQRGYFFTAVETEGIFKFEFLGKAAVATLTFDELGAALDAPDFERLPIKVAADIEVPVQAFVRYINTFDDYQDGTEQSDRLVSPGPNTLAIELPIGFSPAEAKIIADITIQLAAVAATSGTLSLNRDYAYLEPADVVLVYDRDGNLYRVRLTTKNEADGVLSFDWVLDDATIFNSGALTAGNYTNSTLVNPKIDTDLEVLDMPLLRDADDFTGVYIATQGADGWPGAAVLRSNDGATYTRAIDSTRLAVIGVANGTLGNFTGGDLFDETNTLSVTVNAPGQLASYTRDELLQFPYGAYLIGSEVVQAATATLTGTDVDGNNIYTLSRLLRGRRGTEWAISAHGADERIVLLTESTLSRLALNVSDIDQLRYFNGVTFGRNETTGDIETLTFASVSQKPFSVVDIRGSRNGSGDLTIDWKRRTRKSVNDVMALYPLGEESELYDVVIYSNNTYGTVTRTISGVTSATTIYTSAQQVADFGSNQATVYVKVFQRSATAGRGYESRKAI